MKNYHLIVLAVFVSSFLSCENKKTEHTAQSDTLAIQYTILTTLPHNKEAFTEGLVIHNSTILESTGQNSWIAEVNANNGIHDKKVILDSLYFGEGITVLNNKIYQLTYKNKKGFIYDASTYKQIGEFPFTTKTSEGWGITHNKKNLIVSDGSENIYFLDTVNFKIVNAIIVTEGKLLQKNLNELEFINGFIFANVWETPFILKINPSNGKVIGRLNLSTLTNEIKKQYPDADVLNGIAYDTKAKAMMITGKLWPKSYLIKIE